MGLDALDFLLGVLAAGRAIAERVDLVAQPVVQSCELLVEFGSAFRGGRCFRFHRSVVICRFRGVFLYLFLSFFVS